jgi:predicted Zn finger-like uncharacterized protein
MTLLTRCPACETYFRVVPDQLRISEGWVKCGRCGDIFDAAQYLQEVSDEQSIVDAEREVDAPEAASPPSVLLEDKNSDPVGDQPRQEVESSESQAKSAVAVHSVEAALQESQGSAIALELTDLTLEFPEDAPMPPSVTACSPEVQVLSTDVREQDVVGHVSDSKFESVDQIMTDVPLSFMDQPTPAGLWQKPVVRGLMWMLMLVSGFVLAGQWSYRERDRLAATFPEIKPALQQACDWFGCVIEPLRQVDALGVDAVSFSSIGVNTYRLNFVVKNAATLPLARPAVELVLTDALDQPTYRRVFSVDELGAKGQALKGGAEWPVNVALRIEGVNPPARVLGYRLLLFYP